MAKAEINPNFEDRVNGFLVGALGPLVLGPVGMKFAPDVAQGLTDVFTNFALIEKLPEIAQREPLQMAIAGLTAFVCYKSFNALNTVGTAGFAALNGRVANKAEAAPTPAA